MKPLRILCRILAGMVFVFSGFVKAVDPLGFTYKLQDYFAAFHLDFFSGMAFPLVILLVTLELTIGLNLLFGIRMKLTAWLLLLFMSFFTVLTFILAIYNPVSDCGCFGDAIILTNWQTFWKNIIIFIPTLVVFLQRNRFKEPYGEGAQWVLVSLFALSGILLSVYCYHNLPVMDFRPYSVGTHIPDKMVIPEGMPPDEYETILVYQKDGVSKEFTMENYPWQDTTWKWVETRQNLIKKGYEPPIHDFVITSAERGDITEELLNDPGYVFLVVAYELEKTNRKAFETINKVAEEGLSRGFKTVLLTSSVSDEITAFRESGKPPFAICTADEIMLKTVIRANPGIVLLRQGTILGKWHYRNFKAENFRNSNLDAVMLDHYRKNREGLRVALIALVLVIITGAFHMMQKSV